MRAHGALAVVVAVALSGAAAAVLNPFPALPVVNGSFEQKLPGQAIACGTFGDFEMHLPKELAPLAYPVDAAAGTSLERELDGTDLVVVYPCQAGALKAFGWSSSADVAFEDADGSGDVEAVLPATGSPYLYQSFASAHQAFSGHFDWFSFTREAGAIPASAIVQLLFVQNASPFVGPFHDCVLTFHAALMGAGPRVRIPPAAGALTDAQPDDGWCDDLPSRWNDGSLAERTQILRDMRIVQVSFWGFRDVTLDDVSIDGATLAGGQLG